MQKEFSSHIHMSCPICSFEVIHLDSTRQKVYYLFKDGSIDIQTGERDKVSPYEHGTQCNSKYCDWKEGK